uniref:Uncharacterized protein n=1 Tax=uncultured prokaryote TaxID=198431 RepID=A0A0H5PWM1_9ZZZZ|nr:hypothetical protein [uncultured prokaryote]
MPIPVGFAQANFVFGGTPVPNGAEITLGLSMGSSGLSPALAAEALYGIADDTWLQSLTELTVLESVDVKFGPDATGPSGTFGGTANGTSVSQGASPAVCFLVQKHTALGGRAGRGRMYLPGVSENAVTEQGAVSQQYIDALNSQWATFLTDASNAGMDPVLLHGVGSPISIPTPITSFSVSAIAATQRLRQRR